MAHDREIAGIRCSTILEGLSDYLDGTLPASVRAQVDAHLAECTWCEQFGGEFASMVTVLRGGPAPETSPADVEGVLALLDD
jgi:anti-sigma factor RsiW